MIILIIIGVALVAIALWVVTTYNALTHTKALVQEGWSGIDVQLKRRYDLIPNLVNVVKGYSFHEKSIVEDIVRMRAASMGASNVEQKEQAETGLSYSLKSLFALAEQYPDLKANQNFLALQKDLGTIEEELQLSRRYYNGTVRNYNVLIKQFPGSVVASFFNFTYVPYFEITESQERDVPTIKF